MSDQATKRPAASADARARTWTGPSAGYRRRLSRYRTRRLLEFHLLAMAVTAVVAVSALLVSYREVVLSADGLRSEAAPAVQGVAATRLALLRADWEANAAVEKGLDDVEGAGETYQRQLSAADQSLSRLAENTSENLGTVNGLLTSYRNSITLGADRYHDDEQIQKQKLRQAGSLLTRSEVGLVPRLDALQDTQMGRAERLATMGAAGYTGWVVAELALLVLALTLLSALWVLRDRCGRDHNPWLLGALVLTVALAVVPLLATSATQRHLDNVRDTLIEIRNVAEQAKRYPEADDLAQRKQLDDAQIEVSDTSQEVRDELRAPEWQNSVYYGALGGGILVAVLPAVGMGRRLNADYWRAR
ncbi:hypothetical protein [Streptomyces yerevanensis]|uniref:hypothetical protein n=1 Tax=Streptomyces yerevanensis TaxID=66378 RepID=UPI000AC873E3|nr:hypothetical protein [Streptomyces yerevanensis]